MAIFDFLGKGERIQAQLLKKRFYYGIVPNWLRGIKIAKLEIRETDGKNYEELKHEYLELFHLPSDLSLNSMPFDRLEQLQIQIFTTKQLWVHSKQRWSIGWLNGEELFDTKNWPEKAVHKIREKIARIHLHQMPNSYSA